jgi:hypothetical protein
MISCENLLGFLLLRSRQIFHPREISAAKLSLGETFFRQISDGVISAKTQFL